MFFVPFFLHHLQFQQILNKEIFTSKAVTCNGGDLDCTFTGGTLSITVTETGTELTDVTGLEEGENVETIELSGEQTSFTFTKIPETVTSITDSDQTIKTLTFTQFPKDTVKLTSFDVLETVDINTDSTISLSGITSNVVFKLEIETIKFGTITITGDDTTTLLPVSFTQQQHTITFPTGFTTVEIKRISK